VSPDASSWPLPSSWRRPESVRARPDHRSGKPGHLGWRFGRKPSFSPTATLLPSAPLGVGRKRFTSPPVMERPRSWFPPGMGRPRCHRGASGPVTLAVSDDRTSTRNGRMLFGDSRLGEMGAPCYFHGELWNLPVAFYGGKRKRAAFRSVLRLHPRTRPGQGPSVFLLNTRFG
jgi:hypothetical protein